MRIRKNTDISTELYEKEIKKLREENKEELQAEKISKNESEYRTV